MSCGWDSTLVEEAGGVPVEGIEESAQQVQEILDRAKEFSRIPPEEFTELESGLEGIEGEREGERGGGGGEVKTQPLDSYPPSRGKDLDSGQHLEPRGAAMEASELTELNREPGKSEPSKQEEREAGKDEGMDSEADQPSDIDHRERDRLGEDHREQETPAKDQAVDLEKHNMPDCDLEPDPELPGSPDDPEQRSRASRSPRTEPGAVGLGGGGGGGGDAFSNRLRKSPAGLSVLESSRASRSGARERNARPLFERSSENTFRELEEAIRGSSRGLERSGEESRTVENGTRTTVLENCAVSEAKELDRGTSEGQRETGTVWTDTQEGGGEREEEREEEGSVKIEIERQAGQIERDEGGHVDTCERGTDTEDSLVPHRVSPEDNSISVERGDPVDDHIVGRLDAFCGTEGEKPRETGALPPALSLEGIRKKEASALLQLTENEVKSERIPETKAQKESNIQQNERGDTDEDVGTETSLREKKETGNATSETNSTSSTANPDTDQRESNIEPDEREDLVAEQLGPRSSLNGVSELEAAFQSTLNAMLLAVMDEAVLQLLREDRDVVFPARPGQDRLDPGNQSDSDQDSAGSESLGGVTEKLVTGVLRDSLSELEQGGQGWGQTEPLEEREWFADGGQAEALAHWTSNDSVQLEMDFRAWSHGETESRSVPSEDRDPVDRHEVGQLDALNKGAQTEDSTNKTESLTRWTLNESSSVSSHKRDPVCMWEVRQLDVLAKEGQAKDIPQIITDTEDLYHSASPEDIPILDLKDINKKTLEQNTRGCGFDKKEDTGTATDGSLTESATVRPTLEQRQKKKAVILLEENSTYSILLERAENRETDIGMPTEPGTSENVPGLGGINKADIFLERLSTDRSLTEAENIQKVLEQRNKKKAVIFLEQNSIKSRLFEIRENRQSSISKRKDLNMTESILEQNMNVHSCTEKQETETVTGGSLTEAAALQPALESRQKKKAVIFLEQNTKYSSCFEKSEDRDIPNRRDGNSEEDFRDCSFSQKEETVEPEMAESATAQSVLEPRNKKKLVIFLEENSQYPGFPEGEKTSDVLTEPGTSSDVLEPKDVHNTGMSLDQNINDRACIQKEEIRQTEIAICESLTEVRTIQRVLEQINVNVTDSSLEQNIGDCGFIQNREAVGETGEPLSDVPETRDVNEAGITQEHNTGVFVVSKETKGSTEKAFRQTFSNSIEIFLEQDVAEAIARLYVSEVLEELAEHLARENFLEQEGRERQRESKTKERWMRERQDRGGREGEDREERGRVEREQRKGEDRGGREVGVCLSTVLECLEVSGLLQNMGGGLREEEKDERERRKQEGKGRENRKKQSFDPDAQKESEKSTPEPDKEPETEPITCMAALETEKKVRARNRDSKESLLPEADSNKRKKKGKGKRGAGEPEASRTPEGTGIPAEREIVLEQTFQDGSVRKKELKNRSVAESLGGSRATVKNEGAAPENGENNKRKLLMGIIAGSKLSAVNVKRERESGKEEGEKEKKGQKESGREKLREKEKAKEKEREKEREREKQEQKEKVKDRVREKQRVGSSRKKGGRSLSLSTEQRREGSRVMQLIVETDIGEKSRRGGQGRREEEEEAQREGREKGESRESPGGGADCVLLEGVVKGKKNRNQTRKVGWSESPVILEQPRTIKSVTFPRHKGRKEALEEKPEKGLAKAEPAVTAEPRTEVENPLKEKGSEDKRRLGDKPTSEIVEGSPVGHRTSSEDILEQKAENHRKMILEQEDDGERSELKQGVSDGCRMSELCVPQNILEQKGGEGTDEQTGGEKNKRTEARSGLTAEHGTFQNRVLERKGENVRMDWWDCAEETGRAESPVPVASCAEPGEIQNAPEPRAEKEPLEEIESWGGREAGKCAERERGREWDRGQGRWERYTERDREWDRERKREGGGRERWRGRKREDRQQADWREGWRQGEPMSRGRQGQCPSDSIPDWRSQREGGERRPRRQRGTWDPSSCDGSPEIESLSPHDQPDPSPLSSSTGHNIRNRRLVGSAGGGGGGPVTGGAGSGAGGRSNHTPANRGQSLTYNNHHQYRPHSSQSYRSWGEQRKERNTGRRWAGGNSNGGVGGRFWENSNGYGSYSYSHRKSWSCLVGSSEGLQENSQKSQGAVCGGSTGEQSQLSYSPPSSSSSSSSLSCTETDRERGRERDTDRERWERERGRSVAAAPLSQDSSLGASWTLFKPPPAFPVDNSSAKTVPKISYASKVKGSNCPPAPNSQPQMLGAIFQNEWGLSFISEPGSAVVAEGGGAVLIEGAPQPHTPPSFGNGVTPDPPAPEEAGGLAPPIPSFPIGCLLKEEEPETELASSDVMSEKQCRHLLDALRYHTREWDQLLNRHKRDPTMVVWYEDSLERPA
ncbi:Nuclear fragile X mental retardation-interacting protein 2 [Acipenser ruthenus]|uniref:Nuclear fragile X mental retardation-interacting protein 2 n=1 Tax=Acipenser ruthenus TaxID=7906 RepID=A0A444UWA1_ACIRT|nr:Nuclear fragile X mental retardation-interacting protein 2 [Acipenser ruthenus]